MKLFSFNTKKQNQVELQNLFSQIDSLLNSARKLFTQSEEIKKVVALEKTAVEKSSAASHQIASMVGTTAAASQELTKTANASNQSVEQALEALAALTEMIGNVSNSSNRLQTSVSNGLKEISSVTTTMQEIREKAKVINDIVFQTKLLSFNASVEAARAGEHGKGFSVVAEEMGNLARASGSAAKEIEDILNLSVEKTNSQIKQVTSELESVASETVHSISEISAKSTEISASFNSLSEFSKNTEFQALEISKATKEQEIGVSEISKSLQDLENSSLHLDRMAIDSYANSSELASNVETINTQFLKLANALGYKLALPKKVFDFNAAISAHVDWKMKLSRYLNNPDGSLHHEKVCLDNACMLGKWIYGDGAEYRNTNPQTFDDLKKSHAEFHKTAGQIILLINTKKKNEAEKMLAAGGHYMKISDNTIRLIQRLKDTVEQTDSFKESA